MSSEVWTMCRHGN